MFVHSIQKLTQDSDEDCKVGSEIYRAFHSEKDDSDDDLDITYIKTLPGGVKKWEDLSKEKAPLSTDKLDELDMNDVGSWEDIIIAAEWPA
jgi:hypothetical protein